MVVCHCTHLSCNRGLFLSSPYLLIPISCPHDGRGNKEQPIKTNEYEKCKHQLAMGSPSQGNNLCAGEGGREGGSSIIILLRAETSSMLGDHFLERRPLGLSVDSFFCFAVMLCSDSCLLPSIHPSIIIVVISVSSFGLIDLGGS